MNFEDRKRTAQSMVVDFLATFSPPRGLDEGQLATRLAQIADSFARRMPVDGDYAERITRVLTQIMDTHQSNTWPPQAAFVMHMPASEISKFRSAETFEPEDEADMISRKMEGGAVVPETAIWGNSAFSLPRNHLDRYRNASVMNWVQTYGPDAENLMFARYGGVVMPYFQ